MSDILTSDLGSLAGSGYQTLLEMCNGGLSFFLWKSLEHVPLGEFNSHFCNQPNSFQEHSQDVFGGVSKSNKDVQR